MTKLTTIDERNRALTQGRSDAFAHGTTPA